MSSTSVVLWAGTLWPAELKCTSPPLMKNIVPVVDLVFPGTPVPYEAAR